jgi:alkylation response protein AidB-like acyl-CoA dehydrogenase
MFVALCSLTAGSLRGTACVDPPHPDRTGQNETVTNHPVFTEEHHALRESVRRYVDKELRPHVEEWEEAGLFPDEVFRRCGELGFLGLHYPEQWGGSGGDLASSLVFIEELGHSACGAIPMALAVQTHMCTPALAEFGTDELKAAYLAPAIAGEKIGAIVLTEPDAGSDVAGIATRATRDGDTWVLNGTKMFITNGTRAQFFTLAAQTEPGARHRGISLFVVDSDLPGVSISRKLDKLGMRASDTAEIAFDDVRVPAANLIGGEPGAGFAQLSWQLQYERLSGAAQSIGQADEVLARTVEYARERKAFGRSIADNQVIAHMLADAATELEAARALTYDTVWRVQQGEYPVAEISMAKKYAAQVQNRLADTCLQVFGGYGYLNEEPVSRAWRDARLQRIGAGTDQIMNEVIAKRLGIRG